MVSIQENGELVKGSWNRREVEKPGTIKGGQFYPAMYATI